MDIGTGYSVSIPITNWDRASNQPVAWGSDEEHNALVQYGYKLGQIGVKPESVRLYTNARYNEGTKEYVCLIAVFQNKQDAFNFAMLYKAEIDDV